MKKLIWKFRYARHIKKLIGLTMREGFRYAESALENIDYDLDECPLYSAQEEAYAWAADCV